MIDFIDVLRNKLKHSPLARRFMRGALWSVFGSVISNFITLVMLMLVARVLGKATYGHFIVIQSTLSMVGVFAGFGIGTAATRYAAELKTSNTTRLGHILSLSERTVIGFGFLGSMGIIFAADWMAERILNAPILSVPLAISACAVLFTALDSYHKSVLIGFESLRAFAVGTVVGAVLGLPIMLFAANSFGLEGAAFAIVIIAILQSSISRYQMSRVLNKNSIRPNNKGCLSEWPVIWHFAFPALLAGALVSPAHWAAQAFLANTQNGYTELATLGIAMQWFNVIMFVPGTAGRVILPILTDHLTKNDLRGSQKILLYAMSANAVVAIPLAVMVSVLSPYIMSLYGSSFMNDYATLVLAATTAALFAIQAPVGNLLAASSRMWLGTLMNGGWAFVYVGMAYLQIDNGAFGILLALAAAYIVHTIWVTHFTMKELWKK